MPIQRPADARPVAAHAFRGFNGLIGHEVVAWRHGFVEMHLEVRPELCNANGLLHGGVLMTLLDSASGFACTFNERATARRLSVTPSLYFPSDRHIRVPLRAFVDFLKSERRRGAS